MAVNQGGKLYIIGPIIIHLNPIIPIDARKREVEKRKKIFQLEFSSSFHFRKLQKRLKFKLSSKFI